MKTHIVLIGALFIAIAGLIWYTTMPSPVEAPPQQEITEVVDGPQSSYMNASEDNIVVDIPTAGAVTGKTFSVKGKARGGWYFEASFPAVLLDANGQEIAQAVGLAEGEWMTEDFVPFTVEFAAPITYMGPATIVLKKDNPSGEPQYDASLSIPITVEY